jgi:hypothetical protein
MYFTEQTWSVIIFWQCQTIVLMVQNCNIVNSSLPSILDSSLRCSFLIEQFLITNYQNRRKMKIRVITKLPNSEQSYKGKVKTLLL